MKTEQDYIKDLTQIRHMMERSTKFLSLTGWSGIMAGIYALIGVLILHLYFNNLKEVFNSLIVRDFNDNIFGVIVLAGIILLLAVGTSVFLSSKKASENNEVLWNPVARKLVFHMFLPLLTGGILILILLSKGLLGLLAPVSLIFYGIAIVNASKFSFDELKYLGITEIILGLVSAYFIELAILCWAIGFGVMHIAYGIYMHWRYEK